jgi:hypothetical protein
MRGFKQLYKIFSRRIYIVGVTNNSICSNCRKLLMKGDRKVDDIYLSEDNKYYCTPCWYVERTRNVGDPSRARELELIAAELGGIPSKLADKVEALIP